MKKLHIIYLLISILLISMCSTVTTYGNDTTSISPLVAWYQKHYPFVTMKDTIYTFETEYTLPSGYHWTDSSQLTPYQNWISHFPLWHRYKPVGRWRGGKAFEAQDVSRVVHLPWKGPIYKDVMFPLRIVAEYLLYTNHEYNFTVVPRAGDTLNYKTYLHSKVSRTGLGKVIVVPAPQREHSKVEYFNFLTDCMRNTNYKSLAASCDSISIDNVAPGDFLIGHDERGRKGVAYVVLNQITDDNNNKLFVVATGCDDPCDFHIPKLNEDKENPWISKERLLELIDGYPYHGIFRWHFKEE